ncbi:hypothetical protein E2C01_009366 [Portunus trituberculatus]|uniref:Uncharacterized protein n=1 Tax=Portunus trituberculatus TaxID=210409 RepID=A0A5B7D4C3_PORTR|nr:hypothetical protein [Portunus trituberculatus]
MECSIQHIPCRTPPFGHRGIHGMSSDQEIRDFTTNLEADLCKLTVCGGKNVTSAGGPGRGKAGPAQPGPAAACSAFILSNQSIQTHAGLSSVARHELALLSQVAAAVG